MLRITVHAVPDERLVLKLAGRVGAREIDVLERQLREYIKDDPTLDLDGVQFIDEEGLAFLAGCIARGVVLRGGSIFVRSLLRAGGLDGT